MVSVPRERFAAMVAEALDSIPEDLRRVMDNVWVVVDDSPPGRLFGLYQGFPLVGRSGYGAGGPVLPDQIRIFRQTICARCRTEDEVRAQVRKTVIHEVGHHFGLDDERLRQLGW